MLLLLIVLVGPSSQFFEKELGTVITAFFNAPSNFVAIGTLKVLSIAPSSQTQASTDQKLGSLPSIERVQNLSLWKSYMREYARDAATIIFYLFVD